MRRYRIGRSETNDIVIPDASVSRQHAEAVELGVGRFVLSDLGSTYGTHVLQGGTWVAANQTEIRSDTAIRFGEFQTTLGEVLARAARPSFGRKPPAPDSRPQPAPPPSQQRPMSGTVQPASEPQAASSAGIRRDAQRVAAPVRRRPPATGKTRALVVGLLAVSMFFVMAGALIVVVLTYGSSEGTQHQEPRTAVGVGPRAFLEACTKNWGVDERRCRCFLTAAGPHLRPEDYDDFSALVDARLSGDATRLEAVLQRATDTRGAEAGSRLSAALKGVGRDCQQ